MKEPIEGRNWFFVDESGDPTFYDRRGNLIVGKPGCSPLLILGFIETINPVAIRRALANLHAAIAADPYLRDVPSIAKTNVAFHAKDDCPEVRYLVFKCIESLDFRAQFIVGRKIERVFKGRFQSKERLFYDQLVSHLFKNVLHRYTHNSIYFSKRGSRDRQAPLKAAIEKGVEAFETQWHTKVSTEITVQSQTPAGEPCLQIIDYMNWAVYRAFTRREMRYYRIVEDKVSLLLDLYDLDNYPNNYYNRRNPFDIEKASPL